MYSLGMDTSHQFLVIALLKDDSVIDSVQLSCFKHQSEYLVPEVQKILERNSLEVRDINNWIVTRGPGSYTGVRIAMTMAKVVCSLEKKNVYTLSTLQLYAGNRDCYVIMDARAKRAYIGRYRNGEALMEDTVYPLTQVDELINEGKVEFMGDLHLFGKGDDYGDIAGNFAVLKNRWEKVENPDLLVPSYLKSNEDYL
ncbi:MAG: tRNA (adenosine(37)-N6)-threonylcarbamoyltransferase complex dimerization subunit type 1 TsaB [Erysipelotrichaceae bacterium]|nr:tRNA (adenosine(37)-N6)-threonylcarbamoyltransferase complex dimerization subunit type 1 TsaB [Erysipelotrichaceae bacterium]